MSGRYARRQIELRTDAFWRRHWRWAVPGVVGACVLAGAVGLLIPVSLPMWVVYPLVVLAVLTAMKPYFYGTYHLEIGAEAERWTSKELRKVCGPEWHVVDGISFAFHDVDHVIVGPGGVYAIETKYTDSRVDLASPRGRELASRWAAQAVEVARSVRLLLLDHKVTEVYAGVVVWGSEVEGTPVFIDGVPIMRRPDLDAEFTPWRQDVRVLNDLQVQAIARTLRAHRDRRIRYEEQNPAA